MMSRKRKGDHLSVVLDDILWGLPPLPPGPTIFRVEDDLRSVSPKHFEPKLISIGAFHHGKTHLQKMERTKLRYLKSLLKRIREYSVDRYIVAMRSLEKKARACYQEEELGDFTSDQFVQMMLVDGCFTVEFLRKLYWVESRERDDPVFLYKWVLNKVQYDLILAENQVPFFVLDELFTMTRDDETDDGDTILFLIQFLARCVSPWRTKIWDQDVPTEGVDHLLGLVHRLWCSPLTKLEGGKLETGAVKSVSELKEFGIQFEKNNETDNGLSIQFIDGVFKLTGVILDESDRVLRNLIAYEHNFVEGRPRFVSNYILFLSSLVSSLEDVKLLRYDGIVTGSCKDEEISRMLESLSRNVFVDFDNCCYSDIYNKVSEFCDFEEGEQSNQVEQIASAS